MESTIDAMIYRAHGVPQNTPIPHSSHFNQPVTPLGKETILRDTLTINPNCPKSFTLVID